VIGLQLAIAVTPALLVLHAAPAFAAPIATVSRYEKTVTGSTLYLQGLAASSQSGITVLDFGQPWYQGGYGTYNWSGSFFSTAQIQGAVEEWIVGWHTGVSQHPSNHMYVSVGESSYFGYTGYADGAAWAQMINAINAWISSPPSWGVNVGALGGIDAETEWSPPATAEAWASGYSANTSAAYYDFGDAGGCPWTYTTSNAQCNGDQYGDPHWHQKDVWNMAWYYPPAWPLPETYYNHNGFQVNAWQWEYISLEGANVFGTAMFPVGSLTQWAAAGGCCGTDTPSEGWSGLQTAMNSYSQTATTLNNSTDITWAN
jgi:hypothetical protein